MKQRFLHSYSFLLALVLLASANFARAQAVHHVCGTDYLQDALLQNPDARRAAEEATRDYVDYMENLVHSGTRVVRTIPVVFHIIQSSSIITVTDAEIQSQLDVLNEDFRRMMGTPGFGNGVDTEYEFCLASIDPNGCPTTGINRLVNAGAAIHDLSNAAQLKGLIQWNPQRYLNVWVPREITTQIAGGQVLGYATFPWNLAGQPNLDGIVIHSEYLGRNASPVYGGRTTTHEVGHWLGLFHTFQGNCNGATASTCNAQGDGVCDTPQASQPNFGCPAVNSCTDSPVDNPDQIENYMDYSNGVCQDMFTQGQKDRMDFMVNNYRSLLVSAGNQSFTGCDGSTAPGCAPTAEFSADVINGCVGQPITFSDLSSGPPTSWSWNFNGATPSTSTSTNPTVTYNSPGVYTVSLVAGNSLGNNTETKPGYITISSPVAPPLSEGFENIFSYPLNWYADQLTGTQPWSLYTGTGATGNKCMRVNNFQANNVGAFADLNTSIVDLSNAPGAQLSFYYAYKRYNGFQIDTLEVGFSTDCGATWTQAWREGGLFLPTVGGNAIASAWVPTQASDWRRVDIDLDSLAGQPEVRIRFKVLSGNGQAIYLDDVNMTGMVNRLDPADNPWQVQVLPNPVEEQFRVDFELPVYSPVTFSLLDLQGRILQTFTTEELAPGQHALPFSGEVVEMLPAGTYLLRAESLAGSTTSKFIRMQP